MAGSNALTKNITFWHAYPQLLVRDLSDEQLCWQPEGHDTTITFAVWHTYRAADELVHGMALQRPSVYARAGWAERLKVAQTGVTPFGNGLSREQIAELRLPMADLLRYAEHVGASINDALASMSDDDAAAPVSLPFFAEVYPGMESLSRLETIVFFAIGHTSEHLGEVQFIKGLMGLRGAPL